MLIEFLKELPYLWLFHSAVYSYTNYKLKNGLHQTSLF